MKRRSDHRKKQRKSAPVPPAAASDGDSSGSEMQLAAEEASDVEPVRGASPTAAAAANEHASAERGSRQDKRHEVLVQAVLGPCLSRIAPSSTFLW